MIYKPLNNLDYDSTARKILNIGDSVILTNYDYKLFTTVTSFPKNTLYLFYSSDKDVINNRGIFYNTFHIDDILMSYSFPHSYWIENGYDIDKIRKMVDSNDEDTHLLLYGMATQLEEKWLKLNKL